eukprot:TRINITY_DN327_c0_g2_i1.p1 TRINITY_DN327_c0_g2~~TRINITY_DN327_c0_g2_i1.p1  ORF type:complete len:454 (+),score=135.95 TRINITY_DN327_c0_g2_i1:46-1407(+)
MQFSDDHQRLVNEVKAKQKGERGFRESWQEYCIENGMGKMDPARHEAQFLKDALKSINAGYTKGSRQGNPKEEAIRAVKDRQRNLPGWKDAWWHYCDVHGAGDKDPSRHDLKFLKRALHVLAVPTDMMAHHGGVGRGYEPIAMDFERQALVEEVKRRQRFMPGFRQYWVEFCHSNGAGGMDPSRHSVEFLRRGLLPPQINHQELVETIKSYQRTNPAFKAEWIAYCNSRGMGVRDPSRHAPEFLTVALRELTGGKGLRGVIVRPQKRGYGHGTQRHRELVEAVKRLQRESPESRQPWIDFCGRWGSSDLDPARHGDEFLQRWLDYMRSPEAAKPPYDLDQVWGQVQAVIDNKANEEALPAREDIIAAIKRGQRNSDTWREAWWSYCDANGNGDRDPARHDMDFIKNAIKELGPPPGLAEGEKDEATEKEKPSEKTEGNKSDDVEKKEKENEEK